jgi:ribosomal protein L10
MAKTRSQKNTALSRLRDNVATQKSVVMLTTYNATKQLDAAGIFDLRKLSNDNGIKLEIVKNTLVPLVFKDTQDLPNLVGQTYLAYMKSGTSVDEIEVPKSIVSLIEDKFKEQVTILGSVVNAEFYSTSQTIALSKTPTLSDSLSMLAGLLKQIGGGRLATVVNQLPSSVARAISEVAKTK